MATCRADLHVFLCCQRGAISAVLLAQTKLAPAYEFDPDDLTRRCGADGTGQFGPKLPRQRDPKAGICRMKLVSNVSPYDQPYPLCQTEE